MSFHLTIRARNSIVKELLRRRPRWWPLVLVASWSALFASWGRPAIRSLIIFMMAPMAAMPSVAKHVHGDEGNSDQYPDPVR